MSLLNPVVWFEIYVDDLDRARFFYQKALDIILTEFPNPTEDGAVMLAFPMNMETKNMASGALVYMQGIKAGTNSTVVYFHSSDCSKEEKRIEMAGGKVVQGKMSLGDYGFAVLGEDTEGNIFGVHSMK